MTEGRRRDEWDRWSGFMCMFANANRDPKKTNEFKQSQFTPFETKPEKPKPGSITDLKVFLRKGP